MKTLLVLLLVTISSTFAQSDPAPHNPKIEATSAKEEKKAAKEQAKAEQKEKERQRVNMTVDFVQLTKFPMNFLNRQYRLNRVTIRDIQPYTDEGVTYYPMALESLNAFTYASPVPDLVTFVMDSTTAQGVVSHIQSMRTGGFWPNNFNPVADVYFQVFQRDVQGRRFYVAKVDCVAVLGVMSKRTKFGNCSLVE